MFSQFRSFYWARAFVQVPCIRKMRQHFAFVFLSPLRSVRVNWGSVFTLSFSILQMARAYAENRGSCFTHSWSCFAYSWALLLIVHWGSLMDVPIVNKVLQIVSWKAPQLALRFSCCEGVAWQILDVGVLFVLALFKAQLGVPILGILIFFLSFSVSFIFFFWQILDVGVLFVLALFKAQLGVPILGILIFFLSFSVSFIFFFFGNRHLSEKNRHLSSQASTKKRKTYQKDQSQHLRAQTST